MSGPTIPAESIPPDEVAAVIARLRSFPELLEFCPDDPPSGSPPRIVKRIGGRFHDVPADWKGLAIAVLGAGGFGPDLYVPTDQPRVAVYCYAKQGHRAALLARMAIAALTPPDRAGEAFTAANCRVIDIWQVGGMVAGYDDDNLVEYRVVSFELLKHQLPVEVSL